MAVNAKAMSINHRPKDAFRRAAVEVIADWAGRHESVDDGRFRYAGAIGTREPMSEVPRPEQNHARRPPGCRDHFHACSGWICGSVSRSRLGCPQGDGGYAGAEGPRGSFRATAACSKYEQSSANGRPPLGKSRRQRIVFQVFHPEVLPPENGVYFAVIVAGELGCFLSFLELMIYAFWGRCSRWRECFSFCMNFRFY